MFILHFTEFFRCRGCQHEAGSGRSSARTIKVARWILANRRSVISGWETTRLENFLAGGPPRNIAHLFREFEPQVS